MAVYVDVILVTPGACAGVWFRFGTSASTTEAGYLLEVCESGYTFATHGYKDGSTIETIRQSFGGTIGRNTRLRVGILARGGTFTFYRNGSPVGQWSDPTFSAGRVSLGILAPGAGSPVAFSDIEIWAPAT